MLEKFLYGFGYAISPLLFLGARTPASIMKRLRLGYRLLGVKILRKSSMLNGTERTEFLCPWRNLFASSLGKRWFCHNKIDRADDGCAAYLQKHRGIYYLRPQACENSENCYSEVSEFGG